MDLTAIRAAAAKDVAGAVGPDVAVIDHLPDSVNPPAVLVAWGDPLLEPNTFGDYTARIELVVIAGRLEPGGQYGTLEELTAQVAGALVEHEGFTMPTVTTPRAVRFGKVTYLATYLLTEYETGC